MPPTIIDTFPPPQFFMPEAPCLFRVQPAGARSRLQKAHRPHLAEDLPVRILRSFSEMQESLLLFFEEEDKSTKPSGTELQGVIIS